MITISEEYQMEKSKYLLFYRFEESPSGSVSLNSVLDNLVSAGFDRKMLETGINRLGICNTSEREKCYNLLEVKSYPIDDNFPNIKKAFVSGKKPEHITKIQYDVVLSGLTSCEIPSVSKHSDCAGSIKPE